MSRKRFAVVVPVVAAIGLTFGGAPAAAGTGDLTAPPPTRADVGTPSPALVRWLRAVELCSEIYPPGTDITDCIRRNF